MSPEIQEGLSWMWSFKLNWEVINVAQALPDKEIISNIGLSTTIESWNETNYIAIFYITFASDNTMKQPVTWAVIVELMQE